MNKETGGLVEVPQSIATRRLLRNAFARFVLVGLPLALAVNLLPPSPGTFAQQEDTAVISDDVDLGAETGNPEEPMEDGQNCIIEVNVATGTTSVVCE